MSDALPTHVAIIMDGNGRWARQQNLPRTKGHQAGLQTAENIVKSCAKQGIKVLTLFAFGVENWKRPRKEVEFLMVLFADSLQKEAHRLIENNIKLNFIGDRSGLSDTLKQLMSEVETASANNTGMQVLVAFNYSGQWDLVQATQKIAQKIGQNELHANDITAEHIQNELVTANWPNPDLLIRTSGEKRISNFMIWQFSYTEFYFCDTLWPDFNETDLTHALQAFAARQRRFGKTGEQLTEHNNVKT